MNSRLYTPDQQKISSHIDVLKYLKEEIGNKYAEIERQHRFRFLFDPLRIIMKKNHLTNFLAGNPNFPASIEIDPSNACNHNCIFCIYQDLHKCNRNEIMDRETIFRVIDEAAQLEVESILFVGGGEPLVNPFTIDAIEHASSLGIDVGLVSNGSLLNSNSIARVKRAAKYIRISLDAATPKTHKKLHNKEDFTTIVKNLRGLVEAEGSCTVGTSFFINEHNYDEISQYVILVKELGVDYTQLKTASGISLPDMIHIGTLIEIGRALDQIEDFSDVHIMSRVIHNESFQIRNYSKCHWHEFKTIINADGSVYPCAQLRTVPEASLGNINYSSLREIWSSQQRLSVINSIDLKSCPYCVHDTQNRLLEFLSYYPSKHSTFY